MKWMNKMLNKKELEIENELIDERLDKLNKEINNLPLCKRRGKLIVEWKWLKWAKIMENGGS